MRLIGEFENEKEARDIYVFLNSHGIRNSADTFSNPQTGKISHRVWILEEEDLQKATDLIANFRVDPNASKEAASQPAFISPPMHFNPQIEGPESKGHNWKINVDVKPRTTLFSLTLTNFVILVCAFIYLWNGMQEARIVKNKGPVAAEIGLTPLQETLLFDDPVQVTLIDQFIATYPLKDVKDIKDLPPDAKAELDKIQTYPSWKGVFDLFLHWNQTGWDYFTEVPLFEKIREGQVWRLFTPVLLHGGFLHILFNMAWVWYLGRQIEERAGKLRMGLMMIIIGILANVVQYLMSGPFFLGYSGIVVGMVGFIWMRQRIAPWEGYPLPRATVIFIIFFVGAMFVLELLSFFLQLFADVKFSPNIANTAHIVGGLLGMGLGKIPLFSRSSP
ncbi:MAG TPA: rhomboid family intramembrane serine protease [Rhabdochlamydiaceae bacterium]|nr:rhomboid family intramembrane serine protease [Rhabdochlamydiaceae bacterium]